MVTFFLVFFVVVARDLVGEAAGVDAGVLLGVGGTFFGVAGGASEIS